MAGTEGGVSVLEEGRRRLLSVLWERLAELEADAIREELWRRTNWDTITGLECSACHRIVFRELVGGQCHICVRVAVSCEKAKAEERIVKGQLRRGMLRGTLDLALLGNRRYRPSGNR